MRDYNLRQIQFKKYILGRVETLGLFVPPSLAFCVPERPHRYNDLEEQSDLLVDLLLLVKTTGVLRKVTCTVSAEVYHRAPRMVSTCCVITLFSYYMTAFTY